MKNCDNSLSVTDVCVVEQVLYVYLMLRGPLWHNFYEKNTGKALSHCILVCHL